MKSVIQYIIWSLLILSCGTKEIHRIPLNEGQPVQDRIVAFLDECEQEVFQEQY